MVISRQWDFFEWNAGLGKNKQTCAKIEDLRSIPRYCNSDHVLIILKQQIYWFSNIDFTLYSQGRFHSILVFFYVCFWCIIHHSLFHNRPTFYTTPRPTSSHQVIMPVLLRVCTRHVGFNWIIFFMIHGQIHKTDRVSWVQLRTVRLY